MVMGSRPSHPFYRCVRGCPRYVLLDIVSNGLDCLLVLVLLWHFTDQFYHTDGDRLEMVSSSTLENVSICSAVTAMSLTAADREVAVFGVEELSFTGSQKLQVAPLQELALSRLQREGVEIAGVHYRAQDPRDPAREPTAATVAHCRLSRWPRLRSCWPSSDCRG